MKIKKYSIKKLKKIMPKTKIKHFVAKNPLYIKCQIKDCEEEVNWLIFDKDKNTIMLCFKHGEEV